MAQTEILFSITLEAVACDSEEEQYSELEEIYESLKKDVGLYPKQVLGLALKLNNLMKHRFRHSVSLSSFLEPSVYVLTRLKFGD